MFPFRVLSRRWRRISAVILRKVISVKYLPFSREFEDLTWNTEFYRGCGKTCQCSSSPFHREEGPGRLHLGAVGPVGLPWSSADAALSRRQCTLAAAAATFHLHWHRHFFDHDAWRSINHIWIICCLRGFIVQHLFFSKPRHYVIWPKSGGNRKLPCQFYVLPNLLQWNAFKAKAVSVVGWVTEEPCWPLVRCLVSCETPRGYYLHLLSSNMCNKDPGPPKVALINIQILSWTSGDWSTSRKTQAALEKHSGVGNDALVQPQSTWG